MAAYLVCDICKKKICNYCSTDETSNTVKIGATYKDRIGSIDTCRDCREKIENFIFRLMDENDVKKEDTVVDPDKKCCYNCKYAEMDIYKNSRCTNKDSSSYNIHMSAERFYCNSFEQKEENKDGNTKS